MLHGLFYVLTVILRFNFPCRYMLSRYASNGFNTDLISLYQSITVYCVTLAGIPMLSGMSRFKNGAKG